MAILTPNPQCNNDIAPSPALLFLLARGSKSWQGSLQVLIVRLLEAIWQVDIKAPPLRIEGIDVAVA
jgi:hypothetical protein